MTAVPGPRFRDQLARLEDFVREWDDGERDYYQIGEDITDLLRWWLPTVAAEVEARVQAAAKIALDVLEGVDCQFFACPGPDEPFVHMATCSVCAGIQQIRAAALASPAPTPRAEEDVCVHGHATDDAHVCGAPR